MRLLSGCEMSGGFVLIVGCLDTVDIFSFEIKAYLESVGEKCFLVNTNTLERDIKKLISLHQKKPFKAVVAFNNLGFSLDYEGENLWDALGIKYVNILMDHPFHFGLKLPYLPKTTKLYLVDRNHVSFINRFYPRIEAGFLPHGGCLYESRKAVGNPGSVRDIDILYPGTLSRALVENLIPNFDSFPELDGAQFSGEVLKQLIDNPDSTTENVIEFALEARGIGFAPEERLKYINAFRFIDGFAVSYFRELSVRILVENGFKVTVIGDGWESCDWKDNPNLKILKRVGPGEVLSYMKKSRIVLNTMTWFKEGGHDRIFNAALCGAVPLTDTSGYINQVFSDGEDISCFRLKELSRLPYIVDELLSDTDYREGLVKRAYQITLKNHTWNNRAEQIIKDLSLL